jgi:D-arabinose 5-phosphate isomerase GutQ
VQIIGVTENPDSAVGRAADFLLRIKVEREPDKFNMLATASTMAVVAVFDAICIALMKVTHYSRDRFAVIHPGGAVGARLKSGDRHLDAIPHGQINRSQSSRATIPRPRGVPKS